MNEYTYTEHFDGQEKLIGITRNDGAFIPVDSANSDYRAYLESLNDNTETE